MKTTAAKKPRKAKLDIPTAIGERTDLGWLVGHINVDGDVYANIVPPKSLREIAPSAWNDSTKSVSGALSYFDSHANTIAMSKAGSKLAQYALDNGFVIPSQDHLEQIYRVLKPGTGKNWLYARSGINLSAVPPTYPYTADFPAQTKLKEFRTGGPEAFAETYYWTSTQHAADSDFAWVQGFGGGDQLTSLKSDHYRACAVRMVKI